MSSLALGFSSGAGGLVGLGVDAGSPRLAGAWPLRPAAIPRGVGAGSLLLGSSPGGAMPKKSRLPDFENRMGADSRIFQSSAMPSLPLEAMVSGCLPTSPLERYTEYRGDLDV